jgi:hypothetical protein
MTQPQTDLAGAELKIPLDLSEWCAKQTLLAWIEEELQTLDWSNPELVAYLRLHPAYQPRMLLSVLTLAYATSVFESDEIVRLCYEDDTFRGLFSGPTPSPAELGRFRRENRGLLKHLLTQTFRRAVRQKFELGEALLPAGLRQFLTEIATVRLDIARHVDLASKGA